MPLEDFVPSNWQLERVRVTTFHGGSAPVLDPVGVWDQAVGMPPESTDARPREGLTRHVAALHGAQLVSLVRPDRVDWALQPLPPSPSVKPPVLPTITPASDALAALGRVVESWLGSGPPVVRMAFAPTLIGPVADLQTGVSELAERIPIPLRYTPDSTDFLYQVNRRRSSQFSPAVSINRLAKWSVMEASLLMLDLGSKTPVPRDASLAFARRLELDINTIPTAAALEGSGSIFGELVSLALEIANEGDVE